MSYLLIILISLFIGYRLGLIDYRLKTINQRLKDLNIKDLNIKTLFKDHRLYIKSLDNELTDYETKEKD